MALIMNVTLEQGRTETIVVTIEGITDWTGLKAKLIAALTFGGTPLITLVGRMYPATNQVSFGTAYTDTATLTDRTLKYEVVIYNDSKSFVQDVTYGILQLKEMVKIDPTT
jgi:hypothetical protein